MDSRIKIGSGAIVTADASAVSILVLMDSRIKIHLHSPHLSSEHLVSILVLMDSRIKIARTGLPILLLSCFNPCFNG